MGLYSTAGRQSGFSSRTVFVWEWEVKFKVRSEQPPLLLSGILN